MRHEDYPVGRPRVGGLGFRWEDNLGPPRATKTPVDSELHANDI